MAWGGALGLGLGARDARDAVQAKRTWWFWPTRKKKASGVWHSCGNLNFYPFCICCFDNQLHVHRCPFAARFPLCCSRNTGSESCT